MILPRMWMLRVFRQRSIEELRVKKRSSCIEVCRALSLSYASDISQSYRRYCQLDLPRRVYRVPLGIIPSLPVFPISSCFRCGVVY
jgi:hypothetical protein